MKARRLKTRKNKQRKRRLNLVSAPIAPMITTSDEALILANAYGVSIYWDNDLNLFLAELDDFSIQLHSTTRSGAAAAAAIAQRLLIENYRAFGYTLPEVG